MGAMGGNPQNVSIPGLYAQQQGMVNSGMFSGAPQSQFPPGYLQQLSLQGLLGFGTGGSNVQGPNYGGPNGGFGAAEPRSGMGSGSGNYAGSESGFRSMAPFAGFSNQGWMPDWMRGLPLGNISDFDQAQGYPQLGKQIGTGLGSILGGPAGGLGGPIGQGIGTGLRNSYVNSHINMSPFNSGMGYGAMGPVSFNDFARMNSSGIPDGSDQVFNPFWLHQG